MEKELKQKRSISLIIAAVSRVTDIGVNEMKSNSRKREVVIARDIAIGLIYTENHVTLQKIGNIFGGRNHATIINSRKKFFDVKEKPMLDMNFSEKLVKVLTLLN